MSSKQQHTRTVAIQRQSLKSRFNSSMRHSEKDFFFSAWFGFGKRQCMDCIVSCYLPLQFEMGRSAHSCTVRRQHNSASVRSMGNMRGISSANNNALLDMKKKKIWMAEFGWTMSNGVAILWEQKHDFFGITTCVRCTFGMGLNHNNKQQFKHILIHLYR